MSDDLNARVCRKMGIEPKRDWVIGIAQRELIHRTFQSKEFAEAWLTAEKKMGISLEYEVWECITYPDLLTEEWAGKLLAMLASRGWRVSSEAFQGPCEKYKESPWWLVTISMGRQPESLHGKTLPEAVCRAIDSMPEGA